MKLKIKICGMREPANIRDVAGLNPDFMGFIFYHESPRYAGKVLDPAVLGRMPARIHKTGVFVNSDFDYISRMISEYSLNTVQLHGNETAGLCNSLMERGIMVIKTFSITANENFRRCSVFTGCTDYFLFDTSVPGFGGSGQKFNWKELAKYDLGHPFFLSGGIGPEDYKTITEIDNPSFYGIDLNSRFEIKTGLKDKAVLEKFISDLRQNH
jgi:phosphoribosylanthranilate isomerase